MQETELRFLIVRQSAPIGAHRFEQPEGADDVGLDEILRAQDGAVHVALGGKIDHRPRAVLRQQPPQQLGIADVALHKGMARVALERREILQIAGIGQLVQIDHALIALHKPIQHKIRADEPCATCNQDHMDAFRAMRLPARISVKANARMRVMPELKFAPMKPAPPVTRIMLPSSFSSEFAHYS